MSVAALTQFIPPIFTSYEERWHAAEFFIKH
jgi:hypothetical protein